MNWAQSPQSVGKGAHFRLFLGPGFLAAGALLVFIWCGEPFDGGERSPGGVVWAAAQKGRAPKTIANTLGISARDRDRLNHYLFRDRRQRVVLERAQEELDAGEIASAVTNLQRILDAGEDSFEWTENPPRLTSVREQALRVIGKLPPSALRVYERMYGAEAQRRLEAAQKTRDSAIYTDVARRFYHTEAGFVAVDWLATRWLDRGESRLARRAWERLAAHPHHRNRFTAAHWVKLSLACRLAGDEARASEVLSQFDGQNVEIGGENVRPEAWLAEVTTSQGETAAEAEWLTAFGNPQRNAVTSGSPPYLVPSWTAGLAGLDSAKFEVSTWETDQLNQALEPTGVANFPLVVGGRVVVRDFEGVRAHALSDGRLLWRFRSEMPLSEIIAGLKMARKSNDLSALEQAYVGNAAWGMLASDGKRVFAVDFEKIPTETPEAEFEQRRTFPRRRARRERYPSDALLSARLIALPLEGNRSGADESLKPLWTVGGADDSESNGDRPLAGHHILGAPLPIDGVLYVMTERDRQMNLVALDSRSGDVLWSQGIALVDQPIQHVTQHDRYAAACTPSFAEGILVCPTGLGILVGVDALTGNLKWVYEYLEVNDSMRRGGGPPGMQSQEVHGHPGFSNLPMIYDGRVFHLPQHSTRIHCFNLLSGEPLWAAASGALGVPRKDAEYLATATDEVVMVVGRRSTRGLSVDDGEELWSLPLGVPSGRGVRVGANYLVPLKSGRVANLDVSTGREIGYYVGLPGAVAESSGLPFGWQERELAEGASPRRPGNLVAYQDVIVSLGPQHLTAFPQAAPLLAETRRKLKQPNAPISDVLLAAKLELVIGELEAADARLEAALSSSLTQSQQAAAESLMTELQYIKLTTGRGNEELTLDYLGRLARTPEERGRYLIQRTELQVEQGDAAGALNSLQEFAALDLQQLLPMADNSDHLVSASAWMPMMLRRLKDELGERAERQVDEFLTEQRREVLKSDSIDRLKAFLARHFDHPEAVPVRLAFARRLIERGEFQRAELLLLKTRRTEDRQAAAIATCLLIELWDRLGLFREAARLLAELETDYGDIAGDDGRTGRQYVEDFPRDSLTWAARRRLSAPDWPVDRVRVTEHRWFESDPQVLESYTGYRQTFVTPDSGTFHLVDKGTTRGSEFSIIDRQSGVTVGSVNVPTGHQYPAWAEDPRTGHLLPMGGPGEVYGLSMLEHSDHKPLWTLKLAEYGSRNQTLLPGPAGPEFCVFQAFQNLYVVDPASGRLRWMRRDLDPDSGLHANRSAGLFGDAEILVAFGPDRQSYTVYRTATGELLRRGRLDVNLRYQARVFGRRLFYVTSSPAAKRIRVWNPLEDRIELDEPFVGGHSWIDDAADELGMIEPGGRFRIIDVLTGEPRLEIQLEREQTAGLQLIRFFSDSERYYLNLRRPLPRVRGMMNVSYGSDRFLPSADVQGELYAIDRKTGKILWERTLPQRSVLNLAEYRLPFLVTLSRVRDYRTSRESMQVEVIDAETGETLALRENILLDRLVNVSYERDEGKLSLHGLRSRIEIEFGPERREFPTFDGVF